MNRKDFLKGIGVVGIGAIIPKYGMTAKTDTASKSRSGGCALLPTETAGPFPLDLTENEFFFRQDIREDYPGAQLSLKMRILGNSSCQPLQNVRVNIWHCSGEGWYSGYDVASNPGQAGTTYLRGYQITDANGEVEFLTILPGIYPGRICHIHFQVFVDSNHSAVSQFTFPIELKNQIFASNPEDYPNGTDPLSFNQDFAFADGHEFQLASLSDNGDGTYDSFLEVSVESDETSGLSYYDARVAKVIETGQNFPNPFKRTTTIPFQLHQSGEVSVELWSLEGKKLKVINQGLLGPGDYSVEVNPEGSGLPSGSLVYQVVVITDNGTYRVPKMMTAGK